jgi:hypothetical protein
VLHSILIKKTNSLSHFMLSFQYVPHTDTKNKEKVKPLNMLYNCKHILTLLAIMLIVMVNSEEITKPIDKKSSSNDVEAVSAINRPRIVKRAWNQLQSGWGKRSNEREVDEPSYEELQRRLMKLYVDQLLANRPNDDDQEYYQEYDNAIEKKSWNQLQGGWGKRDWNQLRGKFTKR